MKNGFRQFILISLLIIIAIYLTACSPGMHMNPYSLTPTLNNQNQIEKPHIQIINANYIYRERQWIAKKNADLKIHYHRPSGFTANTAYYCYKVAPQDVLQIIVWSHAMANAVNSSAAGGSVFDVGNALGSLGKMLPENPNAAHGIANNLFIVNSHGNIFYPYLGNIDVQGKTVSQIQRLITQKLKRFVSNPQVTVTIAAFNSQHIAVTGAVIKPATLPITNVPLTVLTAVTMAGGPIRCGVMLSANTSQQFCADLHDVIVRRKNRVVHVNLNQLTAINGSSNNWILKNNDIVYVPNNNSSRVFVLGAVKVPGPYNMIDGKMTLRDALGDACGANNGSNPRLTYIIRNYQQNPKIFVLNLGSPDALNLASEFDLKPGDVVYVSTALLTNANEIINQFTPTLLSAAAVKSFTN